MNQDKINALSGRELEAAVAEHVMGYEWEEITNNSQFTRGLISPEDDKFNVFTAIVEHKTKGLQYTSFLPRYLTDYNLIFGSGGVVEKMKERGSNWFELSQRNQIDGVWWCAFNSFAAFEVKGETPAEALLKAALIAHFSEKGNKT